MKVQLAIYDALVKANIPHESAKEVAEALEADVNQLATRQDLREVEVTLKQFIVEESRKTLFWTVGLIGGLMTFFKVFG